MEYKGERLPFLDAMVDIETLDNDVTSTITAIGVVLFEIKTGRVIDKFYRTVDLQSSIDIGLTIKADTLSWWLKENSQLLSRILDDPDRVHIALALQELIEWFQGHKPSRIRVWGNSNRFDLGILANALKVCKRKVPWMFYLERDLRTMVDLPNILSEVIYEGPSWLNEVDHKREEIQLAEEQAILTGDARHHPIVDAEVQIRYLTKIIKNLADGIHD